MRSLTQLLIAIALLLTGAADDPPPTFAAEAGDDAVTVIGELEEQAAAGVVVPAELRVVEFGRAHHCGLTLLGPGPPLGPECPMFAPQVRVPECEGAEPLRPLWRRERAEPTAPWGDWVMVQDWSCPAGSTPVLTGYDFARLPLTPSPVTIQPAGGRTLVNIDTITYTSADPQYLTTTVLGITLEVRATPTAWTWDFGDGTPPLVRTTPGAPYPDHDTAHPYTTPGTHTITATTTWTGHYRPVGTTGWTPVDGVATTTTTTQITAEETRAHLVTTDCNQTPTAPGC